MKKWLGFGAVLGLGCIALLSSGFITMGANQSGYEVYKSALKNTKEVKSFTGNLNVKVNVDGKPAVVVDSIIQKDNVNDLSHRKVQVIIGNQKESFDFFTQQDKSYVQLGNGEIYGSEDHQNWNRHWKEDKDGDNVIGEAIFDHLFGNIKQQVKIKDSTNSLKQVSLTLTEKQIPSLIQTIGPIIIQKAGEKNHQKVTMKQKHFMVPGLVENVQKQFPSLTKNVKIMSISSTSEISKNSLIEKQTGQFVITGQDAAGKQHRVVVDIQFDLSQVNQTDPEKIDLKGKEVHVNF